jgi:formamidopyrimidine-DNA glycosylase
MPELPDLVVYLEALASRVMGHRLASISILKPFLLRSVEPGIERLEGRRVVGLDRLGKRLVIALDEDLYIVIHLMIAGRLHWTGPGEKVRRGKHLLAIFELDSGALALTEAGSKKRASVHLIEGAAALAEHDPGGLEVLECSPAELRAALVRENHTLKRSLTDPRILSGIGNSYSDEILHRARLSPFKLSQSLDDHELDRLHQAIVDVLREWIDRLRAEAGGSFPEKVTAFRPEMAVHGRYGQPCPVCQAPVQRIVWASSEACYCARCQTGGRLLADRALSRLLKKDWPRSIEELELRRG